MNNLILLLFLTLGSYASFCDFADYYPKQYVAYYTATPPVIDGNIDEDVWNEVEFTVDFQDIVGPTMPIPRFETQAKMRWDNEWLYVAAWLQEPDIWATFTEDDSVIYYDNDFEVFIDPDGDTHYYKEFEMNAFNTKWSLSLNKPYLNGGYENSTRVYGPAGWSDPDLQSGVQIQGTINYPYDVDKSWTVEMAFPLEAMALNNTVALPPTNGSYWRINFSRVEWQIIVVDGQYQKVPNTPEDNWVWSPQYSVNMHLPEKWGYLQFSTSPVNTDGPVTDPDWTLRYMAQELYYAQGAFYSNTGKYTDNVKDLYPYSPPNVLNGTCDSRIIIFTNGQSYQAYIYSLDGKKKILIQDDRYMWVSSSPGRNFMTPYAVFSLLSLLLLLLG